MDRYTEIRRRLAEKRSIREIARALGCSRRLVRQIQAGSQATPEAPRTRGDPLWMSQVNWSLVIHDLGLGGNPPISGGSEK